MTTKAPTNPNLQMSQNIQNSIKLMAEQKAVELRNLKLDFERSRIVSPRRTISQFSRRNQAKRQSRRESDERQSNGTDVLLNNW